MLSEVFAEPAKDLTPGALRENIAGWDSMGALMLIAELDERFGVELTADVSRQFRQVEDVLLFLKQCGVLVD